MWVNAIVTCLVCGLHFSPSCVTLFLYLCLFVCVCECECVCEVLHCMCVFDVCMCVCIRMNSNEVIVVLLSACHSLLNVCTSECVNVCVCVCITPGMRTMSLSVKFTLFPGCVRLVV